MAICGSRTRKTFDLSRNDWVERAYSSLIVAKDSKVTLSRPVVTFHSKYQLFMVVTCNFRGMTVMVNLLFVAHQLATLYYVL